jgi:epoxyqueuosine reductase QueG
MDKNAVEALCREFLELSPLNLITAGQAIRPDIAGMRIFEPPLLGVAAAGDPLFEELRRPEVIGPHFVPPRGWLPGAASVLSFFLPFTGRVIQANLEDPACPNPEWAHARWEGQVMVAALCLCLVEALCENGEEALAPILDPRFQASDWGKLETMPRFSSNWSERHVAYVCGLGTFGLSAGLITPRGMAGRFGSVLTSLPLPPDRRPYQSYTEYCVRCGACAQRCPAAAISLEEGKKHALCGPLVDKSKEPYRPRYGCGKCQVGVPCQRRIPPRPEARAKETS